TRLEQVHVVYARNLDGILERHEYALARTLFGREREQILAAIGDRALRDLVALAAGQDLHERALTRAVRAHDRVDFARADFQGQAVQDLTIAGTYVKIRNRKHDVVSPSFEACHRQPESLW